MKKPSAIILALLVLIAAFAGCSSPAATQSSAAAPAAPAASSGPPAATTSEPVSEPAGEASGDTIYVLGPTPDHGWTAQAGAYADAKVAEINSAGEWKAVYMSASTGEEQVDQVHTILANGNAAGVVFFALEDSAKAGQEALIGADVPFISFDRIIEGPDKSSILNASGDNWQCGAGIAYWLTQKGMAPGATLVTLIGDNGTVCTRRQEGFEQFLLGEIDYADQHTGESYHIETPWTQEEIDALTADYKTVCNWSADGAYGYLEQQMAGIVAKAKGNDGNLYVFSMDDEMTFGMLNLIEANALDDATKADLEALNVYVSAIGGMAELYAVMDGSGSQAPTAAQYFDDLMSVYFSPKMMENVIGYMLDYLNGANWTYAIGEGKYEPVWIVDAANVGEYEGFTGHAAA
ncbi:MAG: substrate-binding domain-containing protein [Oscillospiraceae bacterium]|jgi:ribose transport system substrate-binding protein|nr:substrate-binding domain-containing protein [Oscillospiraceae bacterium]